MDVLGNRGRCAQPCRLSYELLKQDYNSKYINNNESTSLDKGYLLSTKDLCGLSFIPELINAGVMCFKIEGRMKNPEYVATVTRIYRKYIDLALSKKEYIIDEKDKKDLAQVFNRGGFSDGHLSSNPNRELIYTKKQNHMGIYLGNVSNIKENKGHILLNLNDSLSIGDTVQFEKESSKYTVSELMIKNKNITTANEKQLIEIGRMKGNINIGDKVFKIASKELSNNANLSFQKENIKIPLNAFIVIKKDTPISLKIQSLENKNTLFKDIEIELKSEIVPLEAMSKPIDEDRIINQLKKTNDTIFEFVNIQLDLGDNLFIPSISSLNELRRKSLESILNIARERLLRTSTNINLDSSYLSTKNNNISNNNLNSRGISLLLNILNKNFKYQDLKNIDKIYIPLKYFAIKKYEDIISNICTNFSTYIYLPTVIKTNYFNILENTIESSVNKYNIKGFVLSNISCGVFIKKINKLYKNRFEYIANYTLNVYNNYSKNTLKDIGINTFTISPELNSNTIKNICTINSENSIKKELIVYGNTPLMSSNYCFLGKTNKCYPTCKVYCKEKETAYYLKDRLGFKFRIIPDIVQTVSTIYNSKTISINGSNYDVDSYRIDILDENIEEINNIISTILSNKRLEGNEYTNGNLNREI